MALIGVILLLAGVGAGVVAYLAAQSSSATTTVTALGFSRDATALELVGYGAVALLLFALGWALLSSSARRRARARRDERDAARMSEVEERAETDRLEHERRFEEAGFRDDDLRRRESQLAARHEGLDRRDAELTRREQEWREREGPSVADVVTGRAEGRVSDGTASWSDSDGRAERDTADGRTRELPRTEQADRHERTDASDPADPDPAEGRNGELADETAGRRLDEPAGRPPERRTRPQA